MGHNVVSAKGYAFSAETPAADADETALVQAAQESSELFGAVYRRYVDAIYRYLQLRAGPDDAACGGVSCRHRDPSQVNVSEAQVVDRHRMEAARITWLPGSNTKEERIPSGAGWP
jgi:hypothetical protein